MSTPIQGWYMDPGGSDRLRWWDGTQWTNHLQDATGAIPAPASSSQPQPVEQPRPKIRKASIIACTLAWVFAVASAITAVGFFIGSRALNEKAQKESSEATSQQQKNDEAQTQLDDLKKQLEEYK